MAVALLAGCSQHPPKLDNLSCDGTTCLAGYTCDAVSDICVLTPVVGCSQSSQTCPTTTQTGAACTLSGFQLPCNTATTDCANGGCRLCQTDHKWSSCSPLGGTSAGGGGSSGTSSGSGSTGGNPPGAILTVTSGSGQAFGKGARAISIGQPLIGNMKDTKGEVTFGFAATVQP